MKRKFQLLKPLVRKPGIYIISCIETDKVYIGESLDISARIVQHFEKLRKGTHHNIILQRIFDKYGEETFRIDILKYSNFEETLSKSEKIKILKEDEKFFQEQYGKCVSMDKNTYAWNLNATEEQKEANRKQLDSIREAAMSACKTPLVIYNIKTKEKIEVDSLQEAENYIEQKHIYRNIKDKVYLPYNNYVAFLPEEYNPTLILNTSCTSNASISEVYKLYNLKTGEILSFPSKSQFAMCLTGKRNDKLYDKYTTFIDDNFLTAMQITSIEDFWNAPFVYNRNSRSIKTCILKDYYQALLNYKTDIELSNILGCERRLIPVLFKNKSLADRINEIIETAGHFNKSV